MTDRYTYKLIFTDGGSGISSEVIPNKAPTIEWEDEKDEFKMFKRKKLGDFVFSREYLKEDGSLHIGNGFIFEYVWLLYFDATKQDKEYKITVYDENKSEYVYSGVFSINNIELDIESQTITIKPELNDAYKWILKAEETDVDIVVENRSIINGMATYNAVYNYETYAQIENGTPPDQAPDIPPSGTWITYGNPAANRWIRQVSLYYIDGWTKYGSRWYYGQEDTETITMSFPNCHRLISRNDYIHDTSDTGYDARRRGVIQYILDEILPLEHRLEVKSEFFTNATNYVTNEVNYLMNTLIEQKTDAKDPDATNEATKGVVTFKKLMADLHNMFNIYWFIDDDGYLRIEHYKYFLNGMSSTDGTIHPCVDLSDVLKYKELYTDEGFFNDTQRYEWLSVNRPKLEYWKFMDEDSIEHRSDLNYIEYSENIASSGSRKDRMIALISTDVRYIYEKPEDIGDDGFILYNCKTLTDGGGYEDGTGLIHDVIDVGDISGLTPPPPARMWVNAAFGQEHLIPDYWYYNRPYIHATVYLHQIEQEPSTGVTFEHAEKQLLQKDIIFLLNTSDTFDIKKYIRSLRYERSLTGTDPNHHFNLVADNGEIVEAKLDLETGYYTVTIAYGIY